MLIILPLGWHKSFHSITIVIEHSSVDQRALMPIEPTNATLAVPTLDPNDTILTMVDKEIPSAAVAPCVCICESKELIFL